MFGFGKKEELFAPCEGRCIPLKEVHDPVFSGGMMGEGVAIIPAIGELCAPCDGEIIVLPESLHAVGIRTKNGAEILLHIGIDTVNMNGDGFTTTLKVGDKVSVGDLLVKVDLEKVKNAGYEATTPIVITNMEKVKILEKTESRNVTKGEKLVSYKCA